MYVEVTDGGVCRSDMYVHKRQLASIESINMFFVVFVSYKIIRFITSAVYYGRHRFGVSIQLRPTHTFIIN